MSSTFLLNINRIDGSQVNLCNNKTFNIVPYNAPTIVDDQFYTGKIITGSTVPVSQSLADNNYKLEYLMDTWYFNVTGSVLSPISASNSSSLSGSMCTVYGNLDNVDLNPYAASRVQIYPIDKNLYYNDTFISRETVHLCTDNYGNLTASLIPYVYYQVTLLTVPPRNNNKFIIYPTGSSCNILDIWFVGDVECTEQFPLINESNLPYSSATQLRLFVQNGQQVSSSVSASYSNTASFAFTASYAMNGGSGGSQVSASWASSSLSSSYSTDALSASYAPYVPQVSASWASSSLSSSYANTASFALSVTPTVSASWASSSLSSSISQTSLTASFVSASNIQGLPSQSIAFSNNTQTGLVGTSSLTYNNAASTLQITDGGFAVMNHEGSQFVITQGIGAYSTLGIVNMPCYFGGGSAIIGNDGSGLNLSTSDGVGVNISATIGEGATPPINFITSGSIYSMVIAGNGQISCSIITASLFNGTASYSKQSLSSSWSPFVPTVSASFASASLTSSLLFGTSPAVAQEYIYTGSYYNNQTTGSYTLQQTDNGKLISINNATGSTVTVPSGLNQGFMASFYQSGSGQITITGSGGVVITNRQSYTASYAQFSMFNLVQIMPGIYTTQGDMI